MAHKAVFLDRDGVINDHVNYVNTPDDLEAARVLHEQRVKPSTA